jgi:hypothetical protein
MAQWMAKALAMAACALALSGCARSENCEKGRMNLDRMWEGVQTQAVKLKLASAEATSGSKVSVWSRIESDIELLESSFATEQITWDSAKKKLSQLEQSLAELGAPSTSAFQSFRDSISRAASMQGEFEKSCRY